MESPLQVSFKEFEPTEQLRTLIDSRAARLERLYDKITRCQVVVEQPDRRHHKGGHYAVRIHLGVPGHEIVVDHEPGRQERHTHAEPAVRDAFDALERQLKDWADRVQHKLKQHEEPLRGRIVRLFPYEGYGFVQAPDGEEIYFHRNAVLNADFDDLTEGTTVTWVQTQGVDGPAASTLRIAE